MRERRPAQANTVDGPPCKSCYMAPARPCGRCGEVAPVRARATRDQPDLCANCYWGQVGECAVCGRRRPGHHVSERGGAFHCRTCQPRPHRQCADCGRRRRVRANWPIGPVCDACYARRKRNPQPCSSCHTTAVLVGRTHPTGGEDRDENGELCGPCSGTDIAFACNRCGFPGDIYADGACTRCVVGDRVRGLLSEDEQGTIDPSLHPLAVGLTALDPPVTVLRWLQKGVGPRILAQLVSARATITHASLDALPQDLATRHVREMLVSTGILPRRQESLAGLELWLANVVHGLPADQRRLIVPFAEWSVVRDARRRAARGRYTIRARTADRADISVAIKFLTWLDTNQLELAAVDQQVLDLWLTMHTSLHRSIGSFIRWTTARHLTGALTVPTRRSGLPARFLGEEEHRQQLKRCLNDEQLPLEARIAGALIGLYAVPVTRLVELTTDQFDRDGSGAYLTIDRNPVLLPPKLGHLIEEQIARAASVSALRRPGTDDPLLPVPGAAANPATQRGTPSDVDEAAWLGGHCRPQHRHDRSRGRPSTNRRQRPVRDLSSYRVRLGTVRARQLGGLPRCLPGRRIEGHRRKSPPGRPLTEQQGSASSGRLNDLASRRSSGVWCLISSVRMPKPRPSRRRRVG